MDKKLISITLILASFYISACSPSFNRKNYKAKTTAAASVASVLSMLFAWEANSEGGNSTVGVSASYNLSKSAVGGNFHKGPGATNQGTSASFKVRGGVVGNL